MRPVSVARLGLAVAVGLAAQVGGLGTPAARADTASGSAAVATPSAAEPPPEDPAASPFAPAAGVEVGFGPAYPSFHAPIGQMVLRLGVAFHVAPGLAIAGGGEGGVALAVGNGASEYGYLLRVPLKVYTDVIYSRMLDYRSRRYVNLHMGGSIGQEFALSAQCLSGTCNYVPASMYVGFGFRVGLSYSVASRSAVGLFVRFDNDLAQCNGATDCKSYIQTYTWNIGWTLF
jgi:hypothetical protein